MPIIKGRSCGGSVILNTIILRFSHITMTRSQSRTNEQGLANSLQGAQSETTDGMASTTEFTNQIPSPPETREFANAPGQQSMAGSTDMPMPDGTFGFSDAAPPPTQDPNTFPTSPFQTQMPDYGMGHFLYQITETAQIQIAEQLYVSTEVLAGTSYELKR